MAATVVSVPLDLPVALRELLLKRKIRSAGNLLGVFSEGATGERDLGGMLAAVPGLVPEEQPEWAVWVNALRQCLADAGEVDRRDAARIGRGLPEERALRLAARRALVRAAAECEDESGDGYGDRASAHQAVAYWADASAYPGGFAGCSRTGGEGRALAVGFEGGGSFEEGCCAGGLRRGRLRAGRRDVACPVHATPGLNFASPRSLL